MTDSLVGTQEDEVRGSDGEVDPQLAQACEDAGIDVSIHQKLAEQYSDALAKENPLDSGQKPDRVAIIESHL